MDEQVLQMSVPVVFAPAMVPVIARVGTEGFAQLGGGTRPAWGRELVQPFQDVVLQARFVVVDPHSGGDVHGRHESHPLFDAALVDGLLDVLSDTHELSPFGGIESLVDGVALHESSRDSGY